MLNQDRRYFAKDLLELHCEECERFICYYRISDHYDSTFLCIACHTRLLREQEMDWHIAECEVLNRQLAEQLCGEETGHNYVDITMSTFVMGSTVYDCTRCHHTKMVAHNWSRYEPVNTEVTG